MPPRRRERAPPRAGLFFHDRWYFTAREGLMTMALLFQRWAAEFQNTPMTSPGPVLSRGPPAFLRVAKPHRGFAAGLQPRRVHATSVTPVPRPGLSIPLPSPPPT